MLQIFNYFTTILCLYIGTKQLTDDRIIASYTTSRFIYTYTYTYTYTFTKLTTDIINYYAKLMICYYLYDLLLYIATDAPGKCRGIIHHIITLILILSHVSNYLPMGIGIHYIMLFEYSNFFLLIFQLCNEKQWVKARNIIAFPFVVTYIPIRLIVIPLYSVKYVDILQGMSHLQLILYAPLILFINIFPCIFDHNRVEIYTFSDK